MLGTLKQAHYLTKTGQRIYKNRYKNLEKSKKGKIIAIEIETGEGFIGNSTIEAGLRAKKKFPHKLFFFKRIGYPAVHSLKGFVPATK